ncbi:MAG: radical SAM protein, partial [Serratia marcescens]|nr:radical SAM protein [Serratia marcescens]
MLKLPPLSLYIHIPWCVQKCPYCDFNSHALKGDVPHQEYVDHLLADLDADLPLAGGREISTIFIGGGTPSLLSAEAMQALLDGVRARIRVADDAEITMEANPGTVE